MGAAASATRRCCVTMATVAFTGCPCTIVVPKGFFPAAGHRPHHRQSPRRRRTSPFADDAQLQSELADVVLHDPDVDTVASFIGADGVNPTTNSGRISITLKPRRARATTCGRVIARLASRARPGARHHHSTCSRCRTCRSSTRVSRTQYPVHLDGTDPPRLLDAGPTDARPDAQATGAADVASDQQNGGLRAVADHRSRHARADSASPAADRRHALRRLRPAAGLDDLHPGATSTT